MYLIICITIYYNYSNKYISIHIIYDNIISPT